MADNARTYDFADLARILRRKASTIGRHIHHLQKHHGFPAELPGRRRKKLYSIARVDAWLADPDAPVIRAEPPADNPDLAASRDRLDRRFGAVAPAYL